MISGGAPSSSRVRKVGFAAGFVVFAGILLVPLPPDATLSPVGKRTAAVAALMAVWWMTEAIPIPSISLYLCAGGISALME